MKGRSGRMPLIAQMMFSVSHERPLAIDGDSEYKLLLINWPDNVSGNQTDSTQIQITYESYRMADLQKLVAELMYAVLGINGETCR